MIITVTKDEVKTIKEQLEVILPMYYELFEILEEDKMSAEEGLDKIINDFKGEYNPEYPGDIEFTIPENRVIFFFGILGDYSALVVKVAKIVKPTIELVMSDCKEDFINLTRKLECL